jgi:TP901 family phage tail tape measure protein
MADDIQSNIRINVDTASAMDSIRLLQNQISAFHTQMSKMGAASAADSKNMQQNLINSINSTGAFAANMTKVRTTAEQFSYSLEKNKLTMGEYFRYAGGASKTFGKLFKSEFDTINKVARERVKDLQTQYIKMGRDASGAMQAIKVRPLTLDMQNLGTKTQIAAQKQQLLNQLLKQGSTNLLNFGKNTQWAGRQLMVGFTIPLSIMGAAAMRAYKDIEEAAVRLRRVYGDLGTTNMETDKMVKEIQLLAQEYTKYGVAVKDSMDMAATAAATGKKGADLLAQVASSARLAVLGGVDQQMALKTTISLTDAFGVSTKQLSKDINFLNAVENQTVLSIEDMTIAIPKAAPVIQQLGGDVKDLAFFLTAMKEGGINASESANALKSGLASLINPTNTASKMLQGFGINLNAIVKGNKGDVKKTVIDFAQALDKLDPLNRAKAIEQLFGKFQFARMSTLFKNVIEQGSQASEVLKLASTSSLELSMLAQRELGKIEQSPLYKFQKAIADFQAQLAPVGEQFMKALTPIINFGTDVLKNFNGLGEGVKGFIVKFVAVAGVVGPVLLMSFGLIANAVANVIKGFALMKDIFNKTGKSSLSLGEQVNYMTQEQIQASAIASSLDQVHSKLKQTFTSEAAAVDMLTAAYQRSVAAQRGFAVPITPRGPVRKYATGGFISGPGTGTSDSIPAMLSNGEAVIPAKSVSQNKDLVQSLINDSLPRFATGGIIGTPSESLMQQVKGTSAVIAYGAHQPFTSAHQGIAQRGMSMAEESGMPFFQFTSNQGKARRSVLGDDLKSRMISEAIGRNPEFAKNPFELMAILSKAGIKDVNILLGEDRMKSPVWEAAAKEFGITITKTGIPRPVGSTSGTMARAAAASGNIGMFESLLASGMSKSTKSEIFKSLFSAATGRGRKFSNGGMISGPGSGTSDSILAMVSNGEAIIPASSVAKNPGMVRQLISGNIPGYKFGKTGKYAGEQMSLPGGAELAHFSESVSMSASELLDSAKAQGATQAELNKIIAASQNDLDKKLKSFDSRVERVSKEFNQGVGETGTGKSIPRELAYRDLVERGRDARSPIIDRMIKNGVSPDAALAAADEITKKVKANLDGLGKEVKITAEEVNRITDNAYEAVAETNPDIKSALDQQKKISNYKDESGDRGAKGQRRGFGKYSFIKQRNYLKNLPAKLGFDTAYGASAFKTTQEMEDISGMTGREISNSFKKLTPEQKIKVHAELKNGAEAFVKALMNETGQAVVQGVKDSTKQASPSKEAHTAGANIGKGAIQGIQSQVDDAKKAGTQVGTAAAQGVSQSGRTNRRSGSEGNLIYVDGRGYVSEGQLARDQALANAPMIGPREGTRLEKLKAGMNANSIYRNIQKADTDKLAGGIRNKAFGASGALALGSMVVPGEAGQMMGMASMLTSFSGMGAGTVAKGMKLLSVNTIGLGLKFLKFVPYVGAAVTAFEIFDKAIVPLIRKNADAFDAISDTLNITKDKIKGINDFFGTDIKATGIRNTTIVSGSQTTTQATAAQQFQQSQQFKDIYQESAQKMKNLSDTEFKTAMQFMATDLFGQGMDKELVTAIIDAIAIEAKKSRVSLAPELFSLDNPETKALMEKNINNVFNTISEISNRNANVGIMAPEDSAKIKASQAQIASYMSSLSGQFANGTISGKEFEIQYQKLINTTNTKLGASGIATLKAAFISLNAEIGNTIAKLSDPQFEIVSRALLAGVTGTKESMRVFEWGTESQKQAQTKLYDEAYQLTLKQTAESKKLNSQISGINSQTQDNVKLEQNINDKYDKRITQIEKIKKLNDQIAKSQEGQLSLAEALNQGDIGAAAKAAIDIQKTDVQNALDRQQTGLEDARKAELKPLNDAQQKNTDAVNALTAKINEINNQPPPPVKNIPGAENIKEPVGAVEGFLNLLGFNRQTLTDIGEKFGIKPLWQASGGHITGPGSGTSDDIPAMLSNGEYVIRANAVKKIGVNTLDKLNQADRLGYATGGMVRHFKGGGYNGYADGGLVDDGPTSSLYNFVHQLPTTVARGLMTVINPWRWFGNPSKKEQSDLEKSLSQNNKIYKLLAKANNKDYNPITGAIETNNLFGMQNPFIPNGGGYRPLSNNFTITKEDMASRSGTMNHEFGHALDWNLLESGDDIYSGFRKLSPVQSISLFKDAYSSTLPNINRIDKFPAKYLEEVRGDGWKGVLDRLNKKKINYETEIMAYKWWDQRFGSDSNPVPSLDNIWQYRYNVHNDMAHPTHKVGAATYLSAYNDPIGYMKTLGLKVPKEFLKFKNIGAHSRFNFNPDNEFTVAPKDMSYNLNTLKKKFPGAKVKSVTQATPNFANGGMVGYKDGGKAHPGAWNTSYLTQEQKDKQQRNKLYKKGGFQGFEAGFNSWAQDLMGMPVIGDTLKGIGTYLENDKVTNFALSSLALPMNLIGGGVNSWMNTISNIQKGKWGDAALSATGFPAMGDAFASTYGHIFDKNNQYKSQFEVAAQNVIDNKWFGTADPEQAALARIIGGSLNVAADPTTYLGVGLAAKAAKAGSFASKVGKGAVSAGSKVKTAVQTAAAVRSAKNILATLGKTKGIGTEMSKLSPTVAFNMKEEGLIKFLEEGEYKTVRDGVRSTTSDTIPQRQAIESSMMGVPEDALPGQFPAYGFLTTKETVPHTLGSKYPGVSGSTPKLQSQKEKSLKYINPQATASMYGDYTVMTKPSVLGRSTFSYGDSLSIHSAYNMLGLEVPKVSKFASIFNSKTGLATEKKIIEAKITEARKNSRNPYYDSPYVEAQVLGGFTPSEIEKIIFNPDMKSFKWRESGAVQRAVAEMEIRLEEAGLGHIPIEVSPSDSLLKSLIAKHGMYSENELTNAGLVGIPKPNAKFNINNIFKNASSFANKFRKPQNYSNLIKSPIERIKSKTKEYTNDLLGKANTSGLLQKANKKIVKPIVKPFRDAKTLLLAKQYEKSLSEVPHISDLGLPGADVQYRMFMDKMNLGKGNRIAQASAQVYPDEIAASLNISQDDLDGILALISGNIKNKNSTIGTFNGAIREHMSPTSSHLNNYVRETRYSADDIYLELNKNFRGKGIAQKFTTQYMELLKKAGVNRINIDAAMTDGGYAWARAGFKFRGRPKELIERMDMFASAVDDPKFLNLLDRLMNDPVKDLPLPKDILALKTNWRKYLSENQITAAVEELERSGGTASARMKVNLDTTSLGELLLRGSNWQGYKDLVSPSFVERVKPMLTSAGSVGKSLLEKTKYLTNYKLPYAVKEAAGKVGSLPSLFAGKFKKAPYTRIDEQIGDASIPTFKIGGKRFAFQGYDNVLNKQNPEKFNELNNMGMNIVDTTPEGLLEASLKLNPFSIKNKVLLNNFRKNKIGKKEIKLIDNIGASVSVDGSGKALMSESTSGFADIVSALSGNRNAKKIVNAKRKSLYEIMQENILASKAENQKDMARWDFGDAANPKDVPIFHQTKHTVIRDRKGNVHLLPHGYYDRRPARASLHFTTHAPVNTQPNHFGGNWSGAETIIVSDLESMMKNNGLPYAMNSYDTWWMKFHKKMKIENPSIIRQTDNVESHTNELIKRGLIKKGETAPLLMEDAKTKEILQLIKQNYSDAERLEIQQLVNKIENNNRKIRENRTYAEEQSGTGEQELQLSSRLGENVRSNFGIKLDSLSSSMSETEILSEIAVQLAKKQIKNNSYPSRLGAHGVGGELDNSLTALAKLLNVKRGLHNDSIVGQKEGVGFLGSLKTFYNNNKIIGTDSFESLRAQILGGHFNTKVNFNKNLDDEYDSFGLPNVQGATGGLLKNGRFHYATGGFVMPSPEPAPAQYANGGMVKAAIGGMLLNGKMYGGFANGGMVPSKFAMGGYAMGTDTVPAMLTPGEFVIKKSAVDRIGASTLAKINGYADGGVVGGVSAVAGDSVYNSNTYEINVNVSSNSNPDQIANAVMTKIRQIDNGRVRGLNG